MFTKLKSSKNLRVAVSGALAVFLASVLVACPTPPPPPPPPPVDPPPVVIPSLAPGLIVEVEEVVVPEDLMPEVIFTLKDDKGNLVNVNELSDGRWILGYLETPAPGSTARFISYTTSIEDPDRTPNSGDEAVQANYDTARLNGITDNGDGSYTYKFASVIPADYDPNANHQLAGQFRRAFVVDGKSYVYNLIHPFVPDTGEVTQVAMREIVLTESCNECHTRLGFHGDVRREVQLCIMCHNTQSTDAQSGNSVDFPTLIHKIHRGAQLPSVESGEAYEIVGFGGTVHDYSDVHFPQDIRNCAVCHDGGAQADFHMTQPTHAGCASCHDRTWFGSQDAIPEGWEMHVGGSHENDQLCALCHTPTAPGASPILEAHIIPTQSDQAPGLSFEVLDVDIAAVKQGANPQVQLTFGAFDKSGAAITDLTQLSSLASTVAWPAPEYQSYVRESILGSPNLLANGDGSFTYTFASMDIPTTEGITFAVGMEGRRTFEFRGETHTQGTENNALTYFTTDGSEPVARRQIVDEAKCTTCHSEIRMHGEQRVGVEYCVLCHNPNTTDFSRRPADQLPAVTVNFKDMIHKIHTGEDLDGPYTVYGFGNTAHDFTHVRFPGLMQECSICHMDGAEQLPLAEEAAPTIVRDALGDVVTATLPETASCTSCHDNVLSVFHAQLQSDLGAGVESCAVCHGADADFAVSLVHALAP